MHLRELTFLNAPAVVPAFHRLARTEAQHASSVNAEFINGYQEPLRALKSAVKHVRDRRLHMYELCSSGHTKGVGRIIESTGIALPDSPGFNVKGYYLDYWLIHGAKPVTHRVAAESIVKEGLWLATSRRKQGSRNCTFFTCVPADGPELNQGFAAIMGEPFTRARLITDDIIGGDKYGISAGGASLDIYLQTTTLADHEDDIDKEA